MQLKLAWMQGLFAVIILTECVAAVDVPFKCFSDLTFWSTLQSHLP